ncbi:MAG TPA: hypothetical protein VKU39_10340 [Streptosporangiaceae bacterium]|nr:hypothetical protein [Streptosporangiaceae bacterium]
MTDRLPVPPEQVAAGLLVNMYSHHWCVTWRACTRPDGTPVIRCSAHQVAVELGEAT